MDNSAQLRASAAERFDKASTEVNGGSLTKSTTPLKRSAARALRDFLKKSISVLLLFGVTRYAFKVAP